MQATGNPDAAMHERLDRIEASLNLLVQQRMVKDWYTTTEFARIVDRAEFTVREWCRLNRIQAQKRACGRGPTQEWMIAHEALVHYQNHGLLPVPTVFAKYQLDRLPLLVRK